MSQKSLSNGAVRYIELLLGIVAIYKHIAVVIFSVRRDVVNSVFAERPSGKLSAVPAKRQYAFRRVCALRKVIEIVCARCNIIVCEYGVRGKCHSVAVVAYDIFKIGHGLFGKVVIGKHIFSRLTFKEENNIILSAFRRLYFSYIVGKKPVLRVISPCYRKRSPRPIHLYSEKLVVIYVKRRGSSRHPNNRLFISYIMSKFCSREISAAKIFLCGLAHYAIVFILRNIYVFGLVILKRHAFSALNKNTVKAFSLFGRKYHIIARKICVAERIGVRVIGI